MTERGLDFSDLLVLPSVFFLFLMQAVRYGESVHVQHAYILQLMVSDHILKTIITENSENESFKIQESCFSFKKKTFRCSTKTMFTVCFCLFFDLYFCFYK